MCRIYREFELNLRIKSRKRIKRAVTEVLTVPKSYNQTWSMDFMHDQFQDGRCVLLFNVMDHFNRESLGMEIDFSLPSGRVIRALEQIIEWRGCPSEIPCDNGPEYISSQFKTCARKRGIHLRFIQPGKPQQNGYVERYNRTVRHDWLSQYLFETLDEMRYFSTKWLWSYNNERPNMGIGDITPAMMLKKAA